MRSHRFWLEHKASREAAVDWGRLLESLGTAHRQGGGNPGNLSLSGSPPSSYLAV